MPTLMRASVLGQAKKPAVPILLHKNLNCSSFSIGFIERALTPRNNSILPDDSTFSPNLLSSLLCPPSPRALKQHLSPWPCTTVTKKSPFISQALRHCRDVQKRLRTLTKWSWLKYPDWLATFTLESPGGRREYQYRVSEKSPAWTRTNFRVSLKPPVMEAGIQRKILKLEVPEWSISKARKYVHIYLQNSYCTHHL